MGVPRAVRNTLISIGVLIILLVGGGLAYTYFLGPDGSQAPAKAEVVPVSDPIGKPSKPAENAKESASIQSLMSPAAPGTNTSLSVRTNATSKCEVLVTYNNVVSTDSGLQPKVADEYGIVSWTWTVASSTPLGKWPVKVTCTYNGRSAVVQGDLEVAKTATP